MSLRCLRALLVFVFLFTVQMAWASSPIWLSLRGYLTSENIQIAQQELAKYKRAQLVVIEIDSNGGDIEQVLDLAKTLYLLKHSQQTKIIVYIDGTALGPAAMLPFVADELYTSIFVSWGDITFGNEGMLPSNILRSQVISLISKPQADKKDLFFLARAMTSKDLPAKDMIEENSWLNFEQLSGAPLVVNQQQLQNAWFVQAQLPIAEFRAKWPSAASLSQSSPNKDSKQAERTNKTQAKLTQSIKMPAGPLIIGHLLIEDHKTAISQATWVYIKNGLDYYKKIKPAFIILELNTPGGEVYAAQKISDGLKEIDTQFDIPVVCYINNWAISAGAMLAYSCRVIAVTKDASMGAAEPVIVGEDQKMQTASEKINSALRTDFANRARFFDRNPAIAEAMVDKDIILVQRHGQIIKLDAESQIRQTGLNPDIVLSPKGKLLTLNAAEMMDYDVADILLLPSKMDALTAAEVAAGTWPASKMLLFSNPFFKQFAHGTVNSFKMNWQTRFLAFLSQPLISSLLLLGVILGFYTELSTPGFGLPGSIGMISLVLIILSSFASEVAGWLELILLVLGILILLAEVFILPSFGLLGFFGILCFFAGLMGLVIPGLSSMHYEVDTHTFNAAGQAALERLPWFLGTILVAFVAMLLLARYLSPYIASYSRLVLKGNEQDISKGYIAVEHPSDMPQPGQEGVVLATLRPAGKVMINGHIWEAVSLGAFIEKDQLVTVLGTDGSSVVVRAAEKWKEIS